LERIRIRVASTGVAWVMPQCSICTRVSEHLIADAIERSIPCPKCGHRMDIRHATIDAVEKRGDIEGTGGATPNPA
jgi:DNA-directed RNA polymerase subunit RPC12/RpoP